MSTSGRLRRLTPFQRALVRAVGLPLLLMLLLAGIFLWQLNSLLVAARWVDHTDRVLAQAHMLQELLLDQETGLRGYLLTGDDTFLAPYRRGVGATGPTLDQLAGLIADNPAQGARLKDLRGQYAAWQAFAEDALQVRASGGDAAAQPLQARGRQIMDAMRADIGGFIGAEMLLRDQRSAAAQERAWWVTLTSLGGALALGALLAIYLTRELRRFSGDYEQALAEAPRQAEALETEREWFRGTLASIGDAVVGTDTRGRVTFLNEVAARLAGVSQEEAVGQPLGAVLRLVNEVTRAPAENPAERALREGAIVGLTNHTLLLRRDGTETPIDDSTAPIRGGDGELHGVVLVFRDISERKAAEEELRASEERLRLLADTMPQLVWTARPDGFRDFFNRRWREYTGLALEQAQGDGWRAILHPEDRDAAVAAWEHAIRAGEPYEIQARFREEATGAYRWFLSRALPLRDRRGRVTQWIGTSTDIDAQKQVEEALREHSEALAQATAALEERNRELDQFAYVASHDLKAPLRGIANLSQWIEEDLGERVTDEIREHLELLRGRVYRMERLIDGILQYSRVGRSAGAVEQVDTGALVAEVVDLLAPPPAFSIRIAPGLPTLQGERLPLQQVFHNLIGNAIKHHDRPDGRVEISAADDGAFYRFAVADDGPGIAPQYHDKIFVIFQTLVPRDQVEGSGLGLSLVKKIVEQKGGRVWVESSEGCGATFYFTWPKQMREGRKR